VEHLNGTFQVKDYLLIQYYHNVKEMLERSKITTIEHIKKTHNSKVDLLSKLAIVKRKGL